MQNQRESFKLDARERKKLEALFAEIKTMLSSSVLEEKFHVDFGFDEELLNVASQFSFTKPCEQSDCLIDLCTSCVEQAELLVQETHKRFMTKLSGDGGPVAPREWPKDAFAGFSDMFSGEIHSEMRRMVSLIAVTMVEQLLRLAEWMISHDAEAELPLEWTATAAEEKEGTHPSSEEGDGPKVVTSQASDTMQTKSGEEGPSEVEKEVEEVEASSNPGRSPAADPVSEEKEHQEESEQSSGGSGEQSSDKEGGPSSPPADNLRDARAERLEMFVQRARERATFFETWAHLLIKCLAFSCNSFIFALHQVRTESQERAQQLYREHPEVSETLLQHADVTFHMTSEALQTETQGITGTVLTALSKMAHLLHHHALQGTRSK